MTTPDVSDRAGFDSRTVRIFISSTLRDFAGEWDLLVRKVFPELRRRCRERQVELVDVDLRWGTTEAEAEQGKVLPICLAENDRARRFCMVMLGERYGWVPAAGQFNGSSSRFENAAMHGVCYPPALSTTHVSLTNRLCDSLPCRTTSLSVIHRKTKRSRTRPARASSREGSAAG